MSGRLDDEKLETLRRWGAGLGADGRDELRAAGKAILILIEEIERLQVDVWHRHDGNRAETVAAPAARSPVPAREPAAGSRAPTLEQVAEEFLSGRDDADGDGDGDGSDGGLEPTLRGRLRRLLPGGPVRSD